MVVSLIHPQTCGFAKVAAWEVTRAVPSKIKRGENESPKEHRERKLQETFARFTQAFVGYNFAIDLKVFRKKLPDLRKKFSTWNPRKIQEREQYLKAFSTDNWRKLSHQRKAEHSLTGCEGCHCRYLEQSFFPVESKQFSSNLKSSPLVAAKDIAQRIPAPTPVKATTRSSRFSSSNI